jgi:hypothetical protein
MVQRVLRQNDKESLMELNNTAKLILNIISPLNTLCIPVFLYLFWGMPNPEGPGRLEAIWYILIGALCLGTWVLSLFYCFRMLRIGREG